MKHHRCLLVLVAGCYGAAHDPPKRPQPTLVDGGEAEVEAVTSKPFFASDGRYIDDHVSLHFRYNGAPVSYTEYRAIVDPKWQKTLDHYDELVERCHRANIPKYIGLASIVGGFAFGIWGSGLVGDNETLQGTIFASMLGFGAASYVAGWAFFGGRACNEASRMWDGEAPWLEDAESDSLPDFNDTTSELKHLTDDFNARIKRGVRPGPSAASIGP